MNENLPIFIAPPAGDIPFVFPMGMIDLIRRMGGKIRGYYPRRLTEETIRKAPVAVLPIHWYFSLRPAMDIAANLKRIHPEIKIVSGGFTAGAYPELIFQRSPIDYIVRGDGEVPFAMLMERLLAGRPAADVPNLSWPGGQTDLSYQVDEKTLGESDNRDVSWFPEFESTALKSQRLADPTMLFPWVVVSRGCKFHCPDCFASPQAQQFLAGRTMVARPAEAVRADLRYWSDRKDIRYCYFNSDFVSTLGMDWTEQALRGPYDLTAYYEWYRLPGDAELSRVLGSFSRMVFGLFFRPGAECLHQEKDHGVDQHERLAEIVRLCRTRARVLLYVTPHLAATHPEYSGQTKRIVGSGNVELKRIDETLVPPIASQSQEERARGFESLLIESEKAVARLRIQHGILGFAFRRAPILFYLLWKLSLIRVKLDFFIHRPSENEP